MSNLSTRELIVETADQLFYQQGFEHTSFSHIAGAISISRGNFYHHFKTKDEILDAVIQLRLAKTQKMLDRWEREGKHPQERIKSFIQILIMNKTDIKRYGCPVGTLCSELAKLNHGSLVDANALLTLFRTWLRKQFVLLGREADADQLALHVLAFSQGVATLANAFKDEKFIKNEVNQMLDWLKLCEENITSSEPASALEPTGEK
ncbi:TetR/AcrR family transcriptional regulator [Hahella aquimaris]|uniref:TetR/AcrR family transcriptional regulator n=1 Tax=Hahella sp. HNIBRBA332 TaxID=3015983 RepID=UPI00273C1BB0|nr:TetR/AcrR family transcriptional regulator [Hahella sp. HNIBRBA332]WLQ16516.1 TetR/AcrR family transcriptional regulator [Hahella sp. HNIBRBA332]